MTVPPDVRDKSKATAREASPELIQLVGLDPATLRAAVPAPAHGGNGSVA